MFDNLQKENLMTEQREVLLDHLYLLIKQWGEEKGILGENASPVSQYLKLVEEVGELSAGISRNDLDSIKDALGDIFVTWVMTTEALGLDPIENIASVYEIISKRKGVMKDGVFVKEEDLKTTES